MSRERRRALQDTAVASVRYAGQRSRAAVPDAITVPRRAIIAIVAIMTATSRPFRRLDHRAELWGGVTIERELIGASH